VFLEYVSKFETKNPLHLCRLVFVLYEKVKKKYWRKEWDKAFGLSPQKGSPTLKNGKDNLHAK